MQIAAIIIVLSFCKCAPGPTYHQDKIAESIKEICRKEYNINVCAKIIGKTIGVYIPLERLFDENLNIDQQISQKIDDVILGTSRVLLSSDTELDFYQVVAADTAQIAAELVMIRYIPDIKKIYCGSISRDEYTKRMLWEVKINTQILARKRVEELFHMMPTGNSDKIIADFFVRKPKVSLEAMIFFRTLKELAMKKNIEYKILKIKSRAIDKNKILVYCRVFEDYTPKTGFMDYDFLSPRQFYNEYLSLVMINRGAATIDQIYSLYHRSEGRQIRRFPDQYITMNNIDEWLETDFVFSDMTTGDFLAKQILKRIKDDLIENFEVSFLQGYFDQEKKNFIFLLSAKSKKPDLLFGETGINHVIDLISNLLYSYEFSDYQTLYLTDISENKELVISREDLEQRELDKMNVIRKFFIKKGKKR
ncbi:MAG: hypothetical protein ABH952_05765 [Candidatus Omnitrophota bacterium]